MSKEKKEETKTTEANQKTINEAILKMETSNTNSSESKSKIQNFKAGTGFKKIQGTTMKQYTVTIAGQARKQFTKIINTCIKIAPEKRQFIQKIRDSFMNKNPAYDHLSKNFITQPSSSKQVRLLRIEFVKKKTHCFMGYEVFNLIFQLSPDIFLKTINSSSQSSSSFKMDMKLNNVGFGFGHSSSSSYQSSHQELMYVQRGLNPEDLQALVQISNIGGSNREMYLEMLRKGEFEEVDY